MKFSSLLIITVLLTLSSIGLIRADITSKCSLEAKCSFDDTSVGVFITDVKEMAHTIADGDEIEKIQAGFKQIQTMMQNGVEELHQNLNNVGELDIFQQGIQKRDQWFESIKRFFEESIKYLK